MNKKGNIENHSKIKLDIYKKYLEAYLSIMINVPNYDNISIVEPFAGKGKSNNGENGSAVIAKNVIESIINNNSKNIRLILNDIKYCEDLEKNLQPYKEDIISCSNKDANEFIIDVLSQNDNNKTHRLFFIDPWGYTQLKGETYQKIFTAERLDFLIFIPLSHIYRFLGNGRRFKSLKPIVNFLSDVGINEKNAENCSDVEEFLEEIKKAFREKAVTEFVYHKILKTKDSQHCLLFSTRHILGAEKFLEILDKIDRQQYLFLPEEPIFIKHIYHQKKTLTNCELYEYGILDSLLPKKVGSILKRLESNNKITVVPKASTRRKGVFYIRNKDKKIEITFK
ncbi:MAG: three-Cys-motif partner protein TcmP [Endomicrobium sp.]|nr:three-Cys-motif partner protein TcmP [Endomicrobium sp.]